MTDQRFAQSVARPWVGGIPGPLGASSRLAATHSCCSGESRGVAKVSFIGSVGYFVPPALHHPLGGQLDRRSYGAEPWRSGSQVSQTGPLSRAANPHHKRVVGETLDCRNGFLTDSSRRNVRPVGSSPSEQPVSHSPCPCDMTLVRPSTSQGHSAEGRIHSAPRLASVDVFTPQSQTLASQSIVSRVAELQRLERATTPKRERTSYARTPSPPRMPSPLRMATGDRMPSPLRQPSSQRRSDRLSRSQRLSSSCEPVTRCAHEAMGTDVRPLHQQHLQSLQASSPVLRPRTPTRLATARTCRDSDWERPRLRPESLDSVRKRLAAVISERSERARSGIGAAGGVCTKQKQPQQATRMDDDCAEYSDRFLPGYERQQLLGRGACAVVWLASSPEGNLVAVKQVAKGTTGKKRSDVESARREIFFGGLLGSLACPGESHSIAKLLDHFETKRDMWLVQEYGGTSLTKSVYDIAGEFVRGERLYRVSHQPFLQLMKQDQSHFKSFLRQLLTALKLLHDYRIVHSDIKPDNILVERQPSQGLPICRFIDFGSAYCFDSSDVGPMATPEYMPPEALEASVGRIAGIGGTRQSIGRAGNGAGNTSSVRIGRRVPGPQEAQSFKSSSLPFSFDIWSLGSIVLELCLGTPLWLSFKCRVADGQKVSAASTGLFAVPGRDPLRILAKQAEALKQRGLSNVLQAAAGVTLDSGLDVLAGFLAWDPMERMSPQEALDHPWMQHKIR